MVTPVFIGDRLTASGYRLAGARPLLWPTEDAVAAFRDALSGRGPVLLTPEVARRLPPAELAAALVAADPPVTIVPDARGTEPGTRLDLLVRRALGVET